MIHRARRVLPLLVLAVSACAFETADGGGADEAVGQTSAAQVVGLPLSPVAGLAKVSTSGSAPFKTGIVISATRVLTGVDGLPTINARIEVAGQPPRGVAWWWEHPQYGIAMLELDAAIGGNFYTPDSTVPPVGSSLTCSGFDTAMGTPVGVGLTTSALDLIGYRGSFGASQSIGTHDDGVPCRDPSTAGFSGLSVSTSGGTHTQVAAAYLAPWIADPYNKTLTIRHDHVGQGSGTLSSAPGGVAACNAVAESHDCNVGFMNGSSIEISATTNTDVKWHGCSSVTAGNTCIVHLNGNQSIRATYGYCDTCFSDCYDYCTSPFGANPNTCRRQCRTTCAPCD